MEKKITITYEVSRESIISAAYLAGIDVSDEMWTKMRQEPLEIPANMLIGENAKQFELCLAFFALGIAGKKDKE